MKRKSQIEIEKLNSHMEKHLKFMKANNFNALDVEDAELEKTLMDSLNDVGYRIICPQCGGIRKVKDGKSQVRLQKYKCKNPNCGKKFTIFTDTVFERTRYPLPVILDIIHGMIEGYSLRMISEDLTDKYPNTYSFSEDNLSFIRIKIMTAIHYAQLKYFEKHPLKGVVQIDETYFHENQSGTEEKKQYNPYKTLKGPRTSLINGKKHSKNRHLSVKSDDFANVVVAVDDEGLCLGSLLGLGATDRSYLDKNIMKYIDFDNVEILCTDGNTIFDPYGKKTVHYILPSSYYKEIKKLGTTDSLGYPITEETLFNKGDLGKIVKDGYSLNFESFIAYRNKYHLSLNSVNSIHSELKKQINNTHNSVVSKYLQYYVSWNCFVHNYKKIFKDERITSKNALFRILAITLQESVEQKKIVKSNKALKEMKIDCVPRINEEDLKKIIVEDKKLQKNLNKKGVTATPEAHTFDKSPSEVIKIMKKGELQDLAKFCGIRNFSTMKVVELRQAFAKVKNLEQKINEYDFAKGFIKSSEDIKSSVEKHNQYIKDKEKN